MTKILFSSVLSTAFAPLILAISWFVIIFAPVLLILALPCFFIAFLVIHPLAAATRTLSELPTRLEIEFPAFARYKARIESALQRKLGALKVPYRACSCLSIEDGRVNLVARFVSDHETFSHHVSGYSLGDAVARLEWKLLQKRIGPHFDDAQTLTWLCPKRGAQCAFRDCVNSKKCPSRLDRGSNFEEVAVVYAET